MPKGLKEFTDNDYTLSVSSMFGCNNTEMPVWEADVILRKLEPVGDLNGNGETTEYNALDKVTMYGCMTMPPVESEAFTEYGFKDQFDLADSVSANFAALFESMIRPDTESPYPETGVFKLDLRNSQGEAPEEMSPDSYNTVLIDSFSYSDLQSLTDFLEYFDNVIVSAIPVTEEYAGRIVALLFSSGDSEAKEAFQDAGWNILPVHTSMVDSISDSGKIQPRKSRKSCAPAGLLKVFRVIDYFITSNCITKKECCSCTLSICSCRNDTHYCLARDRPYCIACY